MRISDAMVQAKRILDKNGVSNGALDALILLSHVICFSKEQIVFNPHFDLSLAQQKQFFDLILRRAHYEPVSHLIGRREFFGEEFLVNKYVLDPRPDSESLIELVLEQFLKKEQKLKILELGVGSGCLIITLLKSYRLAYGVAVDISKRALKVCKKNAASRQVLDRLELRKSNLYSALHPQETFDLIISNPPYIKSEEIKNLPPEVRIYEPRTALDGGKEGLDFYHQISALAKNFLNQNGKIVLEIGFGQKHAIVEIFTAQNFSFITSKFDLSGIERALIFTCNV